MLSSYAASLARVSDRPTISSNAPHVVRDAGSRRLQLRVRRLLPYYVTHPFLVRTLESLMALAQRRSGIKAQRPSF